MPDQAKLGSFARQLLTERVKLMHARATVHVVALPIPVILTVLLFWKVVDQRMILAWCVGMLVLWAWWIVLWRQLGQATKSQEDPQEAIRKRESLSFNFFNGLCWGSHAFISHAASSLEYHMMGTLGISMLVAVMVISYEGVRSRALYATLIPLVCPLLIIQLMMGTLFHAITGLVVLTFTVAMIVFGYHHNRLLVSSQNMRMQLALEKDRAEQANLSKSRFLAAASHDLRQPLHSLSLFSGALQERKLDVDLVGIANNISKSVSGLDALFNALLDVSRLEAGTVKPVISTFSLLELMTRLCSEYAMQAKEKNLEWVCQTEDIIVNSDPVLLETVVRNLISNAIRYTETGRIVVNCKRELNYIRIEVHDTGVGIPEERQEEIFQEFHQLENNHYKTSEGLGLGLAIVKRILPLLDIKLDIISEPGQGSCFGLNIQSATATVPFAPMESESSVGAYDLAGARLLIIDDVKSIRAGMRALFESWSCDVRTAESGENALRILELHDWTPDLIVADYRLKENRTGMQAITEIRELRNANIPALIITGTVPGELAEEPIENVSILYKPVKPERLRSEVQTAVNKYKQTLVTN